jgi:hypothetical protein
MTSSHYQVGLGTRLVLPHVHTKQVLVRGWYYLMSIPSRYWYEAGITLGHTRLVDSLILGVISFHIPGF